jgi:DNA primase
MSIVLTVLNKYELQYKLVKNGKEAHLKCPFKTHNDRTASLYIEVSTGKYFCFGCSTGGNSMQSFVERLTGEKVNLDTLVSPAEQFMFTLNRIYEESGENIQALQKDFYRSEEIRSLYDSFDDITIHAEAMEYLTGPRRKLTEETIRKYRMKFCAFGEYQNRIIIPYFEGDTIVGFNARLLGTDKQLGKDLRYRYLLNQNLFDGYIYRADESKSELAILVEGPFDLMYTSQCGFKNVVSTLSTRVSPKHIMSLMNIKKFIFLFDNDEKKSGEKAMMLASKLILNTLRDREIFYAKLPDFKDPNEASPEELRNSFRALRRITLDEKEKIDKYLLSFAGS